MKTYWDLATDMSKTELRELENRLTVLIEHLLKLVHVTGQLRTDNLRGWNQTVRYQRRDLLNHIMQNRGLKSKLTRSLLDKVYRAAIGTVEKEYPSAFFPVTRSFSLEAVAGPDVIAALNWPDRN